MLARSYSLVASCSTVPCSPPDGALAFWILRRSGSADSVASRPNGRRCALPPRPSGSPDVCAPRLTGPQEEAGESVNTSPAWSQAGAFRSACSGCWQASGKESLYVTISGHFRERGWHARPCRSWQACCEPSRGGGAEETKGGLHRPRSQRERRSHQRPRQAHLSPNRLRVPPLR